MMNKCVAVLLLAILAACSSKDPSAHEIAAILSVKGAGFALSEKQISNVSCTKSAEKYYCKFLISGNPSQMTLVQVGDGYFSELR